MGGVFGHARKLLKGFAPAANTRAQPFAVRCPEGHRLTGVRTEGYQALRCPTCGEGVFVLPRSPLPEPTAPHGTVRATRVRPEPVDESPIALRDDWPTAPDADAAAVPEQADGEIEWVDETEDPPPPAPGLANRGDPAEFAAEEIATAAARPRPKARPVAAKPQAARKPAPPAEEPDDAPIPKRPFLARRNPLIFAAVLLLVLGTFAYRGWRAGRLELPKLAALGKTDGLAALDAGKFDTARQILLEARHAVDSLGDDSPEANAVRQGAKEVEIFTQLSPSSLEDILDEAGRTDPKDWPSQFDLLYKGRSVLIDSLITGQPDGQGRGEYSLEYRIFRPGEGETPRSVGRVDTRGFRLFEQTNPRRGDRVTFGARLASFAFDREGEVWLTSLVPDSGVSIVHRKALEHLGFIDEPATEEERP